MPSSSPNRNELSKVCLAAADRVPCGGETPGQVCRPSRAPFRGTGKCRASGCFPVVVHARQPGRPDTPRHRDTPAVGRMNQADQPCRSGAGIRSVPCRSDFVVRARQNPAVERTESKLVPGTHRVLPFSSSPSATRTITSRTSRFDGPAQCAVDRGRHGGMVGRLVGPSARIRSCRCRGREHPGQQTPADLPRTGG